MAIAAGGCLQSLVDGDRVEPTDYIRDTKYKNWLIEVDYVEGQRPNDAWLDELQQQLGSLVRKDQITIQIGNTLPGRDSWTDQAVLDLRDQYKGAKTSGDTVVTWVAYLDGEPSSGNAIGVAYNWDTVVVYSERIREGCVVALFCTNAEVQKAVLIHEFGHILGLVDRGIPMVNPHTDGSKHSNNSNSVMRPEVETTSLFDLNNVPTRFDANDKLDICAAGGKGSC